MPNTNEYIEIRNVQVKKTVDRLNELEREAADCNGKLAIVAQFTVPSQYSTGEHVLIVKLSKPVEIINTIEEPTRLREISERYNTPMYKNISPF